MDIPTSDSNRKASEEESKIVVSTPKSQEKAVNFNFYDENLLFIDPMIVIDLKN